MRLEKLKNRMIEHVELIDDATLLIVTHDGLQVNVIAEVLNTYDTYLEIHEVEEKKK